MAKYVPPPSPIVNHLAYLVIKPKYLSIHLISAKFWHLANIVLIFKNNVGVCRTNINIGNTNYLTLTGNQCVILNLLNQTFFIEIQFMIAQFCFLNENNRLLVDESKFPLFSNFKAKFLIRLYGLFCFQKLITLSKNLSKL